MARKKKEQTQKIGTYRNKAENYQNRIGTYREKASKKYNELIQRLQSQQEEEKRNKYYQQMNQQAGQGLLRSAAKATGTKPKQTVTLTNRAGTMGNLRTVTGDKILQQEQQKIAQESKIAPYQSVKTTKPAQTDYARQILEGRKKEEEDLKKWESFVLDTVKTTATAAPTATPTPYIRSDYDPDKEKKTVRDVATTPKPTTTPAQTNAKTAKDMRTDQNAGKRNVPAATQEAVKTEQKPALSLEQINNLNTGKGPRESRQNLPEKYKEYIAGQQILTDTSLKGFKTRTGKNTWDDSKSAIENLQTKYTASIDEVKNDLTNLINNGAYNTGTNPMLWNEKMLNVPTTKYKEIADESVKTAQEAKKQYWDLQTEDYADEVFNFYDSWLKKNENTIIGGNGYTVDEKVNATNTLVELNHTTDSRKAESARRTEEYYRYGYDPEITDQEEQRRNAFEWITGQSYDEQNKYMTEADQKQLNVLLDSVIDNAKARTEYSEFEMMQDYSPAMDVADAFTELIPKAEKEQKNREIIQQYTDWAKGRGHSASYDPELHPAVVWTMNTEGDRIPQPQGNELEQAYYWINNPTAMGGMENSMKWAREEYFLNDEQRETFNMLYKDYKENGTPIAKAYWDALKPKMNWFLQEYQKRLNQMTAEIPVVGEIDRAVGYSMQVIGGITGTIGTVLARLGNEDAQKSTSGWFIASKHVRDVREQQNQDIADAVEKLTGSKTAGDIAKFSMNVLDSIGDNVKSTGIAKHLTNGVVTNRTMNIIQAIMSGEATSNAMVSQLEAGRKPIEAARYALAVGTIEGITERASLERIIRPDARSMIKSFPKALGFIAKSAAAEGSEEGAADLAEMIMDGILSDIYDHRTELQQKYNAELRNLVNEGENYQDAARDATRNVLMEKAGDIGMSILAGAISGAAFGAGRTINAAIGIRTEGGNIANRGRVQELIDVGLGTPKTSEGYQMALDLQQRIEAGGKISNKEIGMLKATIEAEASEVLEKARGQELLLPKVSESMNAIDSVNAIAGETRGSAGTDAGMKMASIDDEREAKGTKTEGARGVIHFGENESNFARLIGIRTVEETKKDKRGKEYTEKALKYVIEIDGKEIEVDPHTVQSTDYRTAVLMNRIESAPGLYSPEFTYNVLSEMEKDKGNTAKVLAPLAESIRIAAFTGAEMPKTAMDPEIATRLYEASKQEYKDIRAEDVTKRNAKKPGTGTVWYKGAKLGTNEYTAKTEGLSKETKNMMGAAAQIAMRSGMDIWFVDQEDLEKERGKGRLKFKGALAGLWGIEGYQADDFNGVVLNIEGKKLGTKGFFGQHHIMATFGHEFIHWLQRNSLEGYNNYQNFILEEQRKALGGQGALAEELTRIMNTQGVDLAGAISELVADSSDQIFANKKVIQHIQETNKELYNEIKGFVKNLIARIHHAITGMEGSASRAAQRMYRADINRMAELFNLAYDEATGQVTEAQPAAETAEKAPSVQAAEGYVQAEYVGTGETRTVQARITNPLTMKQGQFSWMPNQTAQSLLDSKEISLTPAQEAELRKVTEHAYEKYEEAWDHIADVLQELGYDGIRMDDGQYIALKNTQTAEEGTIRLSQAEIDAEYEQAVKDKDTEKQDELVKQAATAAGYTDIAYHGTNDFGFTVFDMGRGEQAIFVSYDNTNIANTYVKSESPADEPRRIFTRGRTYWNENPDQIIKLIKETKPAAYFGYKLKNAIYHTEEEYKKIAEEKGEELSEDLIDEHGVIEIVYNNWNGEKYEEEHQYYGYDSTVDYLNDIMGENRGVYELYTKPGKQLVIDADGANWNQINIRGTEIEEYAKLYEDEMWNKPFYDRSNPYWELTTRQIADIAWMAGYDSVRINNVTDHGGRNFEGDYDQGSGDIGIFFRPESVKSADSIVYDDQGNVIPLSERFNPQKTDIRYSQAATEENADALEKDIEESKGPETHYGDHMRFSVAVTDPDTIEFLEKQKKIKTYKTMQLIDGKLYPPMAAVVDGKMEDPSVLGQWEMATEHPELIRKGSKFVLNKGKGQGTVEAAYNPYMHSSNLMINDQFTGAYSRPNLVTVECEVPASEADGAYHAEYAKDSTGWHSWHTGPVAGELRKAKGTERQVFLSRYIKPVRIVPNSEVAQHYAELIKGTDIQVPDNVVPPDLLTELRKAGVPIKESGRVKYSQAQAEDEGTMPVLDEDGNEVAVELPGGTIAATRFSYASFVEENEREKMIKALKKVGYTKEEIEKWMESLDNIANVIATNRTLYDFVADRSKKFLKPNGDVYKKTLDASTMCKKTRLYNGTFNLVQHMMPNTILMPEDLIDLYNIMKGLNLETPCGLCYVQSRRRLLGQYTEDWLKTYKGDYIPSVDEVTTSDGLEKLKVEHPQTYKDFVKAMNKKGVNNPKLVQQRTDYRGDIRNLTKETIRYLKAIGGLRIQSFSDFEVVHMLDMMQAVMDMKAVGLTAQAYTKVPEFAWIFGPTGIKINVSLLGKGTGLDAQGRLVFDDDEGMPFKTAMELRKAYSKNVGTILVGINDKHIIAAMGDSRIDFIIPFHKSGWSENELKKMKTLSAYKDYTETQNEYNITGFDENGQPILEKAESNIDPLSYWEFDKSGEENARTYLKMCAEQGIVPKFRQFLVDNGDGTYSLPEGTSKRDTNIRTGYWKLLIDFKMYDNDGVGSPQTEVEPEFNMEKAMEILDKYDGNHRELPESMEAAKKFVDQYKKNHPLDDVRTRYSQADMNDIDVETWMETRTPGSFRTEDERIMWQTWKKLRNDVRMVNFRIEEYKKQIRALEAKGENMTAEERDQLRGLRNKLEVKQVQLDRLEKELRKTTGTEGFATMMRNANLVIGDFMAGKTQEQVTAAVDTMTNEVERAEKEIAKQEKELQKLGQESAVKTVRAALRSRGMNTAVNALRSQYGTTMSQDELEGRLAEIILKSLKGEDVTADIEALANDVVTRQAGYGSVEAEEALSALRGKTIVIGPGQQAEMKANHITLKDLQKRIKGSGIKLVYGESSTLDTNAEELEAEVPALRGMLGNEKASLENFVGYVENLLSLKNSNAEESGYDVKEVESFIGAMAQIMLNENAGGMSKADLIAKIKAEAGRIGTALNAVRRIRESLGTVRESGAKAQTWTGVLGQDLDQVLDYYDQVARMAARQERTQVRKTLVEQLRAENTKKLMQQQEKYEQMMKNERTARQLANDNMTLRSKINTAVKRISRLMTEETDLKNIPEEAKPLARLLVKMFVEHDSNYRRVTFSDNKQLQRAAENLRGWEKLFGGFDYDHGLDWLVTGEGDTADTELRDAVEEALVDIETGLMEYRNAEGRGTVSLQDRKNALTKIQDAVAKIYNVIQARRYVEIDGKRALTAELAASARDDMQHSRFRGEWTGWLGRRIGTARRFVIYGNMTPVYFFKNLRNGTLSSLFRGYESAENKNGLAIARAQAMMQKIAQETGYGTWDQERRYEIQLEKGGTVRLTLGEMMSLYATWQREMMNQLEENGPTKSFHLTLGGFITEPEQRGGIAGREMQQQRPHRLTEGDMAKITAMMTPQQIEYVTRVVEYMTKEIGELGNEASMRMYGIRKFNEKWYFPFEVWRGVMSSKSTAGVQNAQQNAAAHQSFTKRRTNNARNALMIRDFTQTAARHIVAQINYNTFAPAIEWMQRVMNSKQMEGEDAESMTERNLWAMFQEVYGKDALAYFKKFQQDMNGGATQQSKTFYDRLISTFRKSAVAGSLSVAAQQPLSYIRAAMEINPRWLVEALNPRYYAGSNAEMEKWSGVAVLKRMGKFDMGFGESAAQYIEPEARQRAGRRVYETASDWTTKLPEWMDRVTWTRMWTAAKLEQAHLHPEMDQSSDEFMELVANRFNDIIRRTQVYDSTLVRSQNMRDKNPGLKMLTSFMAEPTLTANVLADAIINARENGGMRRLATAAATYLLSAVAQAAVKGTMGAGRNPDKKKTWKENWWYRFLYNFIGEANPASLIPGYSNIVSMLKDGELDDNAMAMIGKVFDAVKTGYQLVSGKSDDVYRSVEDSAALITQLFTNIPAKNLMRDLRAMYNFFTQPYAQRETSRGVLRYQAQDLLMAGPELLGAINSWLGKEGYQTTVDAYAQRIYQAQKSGDEEAARMMSEYVTLAKSGAEDAEATLNQKLRAIAKKDESASTAETAEYMKENDASVQTVSNYIMDQLKSGKIDGAEARKLLKDNEPEKDDNDIWWKVDRAEYEKETGTDIGGNDKYYRLYDAMESNKAEQINAAVKGMTEHGMTQKQIKDQLSNKYKQKYLNGSQQEKVKIRDAIEKAYKAIGLTAEEAGKIIDGWKEKK